MDRIRHCLGLFNCMINCGESHSPASEKALKDAYAEIDQMHLEVTKLRRQAEIGQAIEYYADVVLSGVDLDGLVEMWKERQEVAADGNL